METFDDFIQRKKHAEIKMKDIGREGFYFFERESLTFMPQHNTNEKFYIIKRLRLVRLEGKISNMNSTIGQIEYRIGYYILGKIGRAKNKWTWGQFCPMIPIEDFNRLIKKAQAEGTIL